ncbi:hypothetical protein ACLM45_10030 [Synechococcus sp. A10-1-5-9]|uniref:hypothetical protein n=1 Tax=Synechococcus sp. A10-1-5-9 TaxID=3392295 RepID=UPI0039EC1149
MGTSRSPILWHLALLIAAMVVGQAGSARIRATSVRFVGRVPATCHQQQQHQGSDRTADAPTSLQHFSWNSRNADRQITCLVY